MNFNKPEDDLNAEFRNGSVLKKKIVERADKKIKRDENKHIDPDNVFNGFRKNKKLYKGTKLKKKLEDKPKLELNVSY